MRKKQEALQICHSEHTDFYQQAGAEVKLEMLALHIKCFQSSDYIHKHLTDIISLFEITED